MDIAVERMKEMQEKQLKKQREKKVVPSCAARLRQLSATTSLAVRLVSSFQPIGIVNAFSITDGWCGC